MTALSNLPPGVTDNMLPGNTPADRDWDDFLNKLSGDEDLQVRLDEIMNDTGKSHDKACDILFDQWLDERDIWEPEAEE